MSEDQIQDEAADNTVDGLSNSVGYTPSVHEQRGNALHHAMTLAERAGITALDEVIAMATKFEAYLKGELAKKPAA